MSKMLNPLSKTNTNNTEHYKQQKKVKTEICNMDSLKYAFYFYSVGLTI